MEDIEWTVVNEGQLLDAMVGHKPVGKNMFLSTKPSARIVLFSRGKQVLSNGPHLRQICR